MLPVVILFLVSGAFAVPSRQPINSLLSRVLDRFNFDSLSVNEINFSIVLEELSAREGSEALAYGQAFAYSGETATGTPGDVCAAANYVNAYTRYIATGNPAGVREALRSYFQNYIKIIDFFALLSEDREAARRSVGTFAGCPGEGRTYNFDEAWDIILGNATSNQLKLITEEYCVAKRLYCSLSARSNNVIAQVTAASLPPSVQIFKLTEREHADFLERVAAKKNLVQSIATLKRALARAVDNFTL